MAKVIKLQIEAGKATPAPPIGPALGQAGINIQDFCMRFNADTQDKTGNIIPVEIIVDEKTRKYDLVYHTPPASVLLKKAAGIKKAAGNPLTETAGTVTKDQIKEIAETKMPDLNTDNIEAAMKIIEGTAKQMGIKVQ
ncbi:50S ribosomal protein L11 [Patescibacteria group bacterium]|nr:50S ribosomal protein L11 [Patescibacteria group bacterium]